MDESEDNLCPEDRKSTDSPLTIKNKPKKRSLIERELETNLTSRITSPAIINDGTSTSRYGRARRLKSEFEQLDTKQVTAELKSPLMERSPVRALTQSPVYKMHASNSPLKRTESPKKMIEQFLDNQIESIYQENISLSRFGNEEVSAAAISPAKRFPKVYIRKDLIQKREPEDTVTVIQNMFSPTKSAKKSSSTHLNNILERSSERYSLNNKSQNGYMGNSSVVKTLDFDSKKKKKNNKDTKVLPSKSELFDLEARCPYQVGDLAWARMGTYPFWPSIVTRDPSTGIFVKKKLYGRIERDVIHVTFFGDNGRRSWIVDNMLRKYVGQLEFEAARENFTPEAKKKDPKLYAAYFISEKKLPLWNNSVDEAEMLLREPKRLRIDLFNDMLAKTRYNKAKQPKSKISRTDSDVSLSESLYDSLFSEEDGKSDVDGSKSRSRKKSLDMFEVVTACLDNMAAKTGITKIQRQSHMDRWLQKAKSKTPEKTQTKTQLTIHKKDKKEATLKVSKKKKNSTPKRKSYPVRKSYSLRKSNVSHRLVANEMEIDSEDTGTNHTFSDHEGSKEGNEICIIAKVESLAQKTQDKIVETVLSNETGHSESFKDSSTCDSETNTEEYSSFINDASKSIIINEDKSVISTPNTETLSKSFISENSISIAQDSSKVDFEFEKDRNENQDRVNSETSNADLSSEVGHSIESGIDEKEFYSGLESKSDDIEIQNSKNTKTSNKDHSPEVEYNSKKRDLIELRRSSRRNVYSETKNIISKQDSVAMRNDTDEKELKSGLESQSKNIEIQNITNMETTNEDNSQVVVLNSKKTDFIRSSRGNINSEAYNILATQDSAAVRSSIDEKELDSGLESKSDNIKIQNSTNMQTRNEGHSSQVEFNCNKRDSVKLRRSSRRNVSSERSNILANQDSSGIDEKDLRSRLKSQSDNIEIQNSTNIETLNDDHSPKVEFNSKKSDDVNLKRSSRENITSETNNIIAKQDNAAMRTGKEENELYSGLESDNIELENSTNTETSNEDYNAKVEFNSKKRDSVELRRSSRGNIHSETNSIIAKQDSAAMRTNLDESEFYGGLDSISDNIKTQDSINTKTTNEEKVEINSKKTDSVELRRSSRGNIHSETNSIIAKQDSAAMRTNLDKSEFYGGLDSEINSKKTDSVELRRSSRGNIHSETNSTIAKQDSAAMRTNLDKSEFYGGVDSKSDNIKTQDSMNTKTTNEEKVEINSKKTDSVELRRSSRGNIHSETNCIIAKQDSAAIRTNLDESEFYGGLESKSDNIKTQDSMNTKTTNEEKVEINSKKTDSVELRRSSRRNVNSETNNIIAKQDSAAMSLHRPAQVSQTNNTVQNDTVDNLSAKTCESIAVTNTNTEDIQYQNEKVDKYDTSNVTKEDKGGITLTTQENIETFYKHSSNINKGVDDIEENEAENMSIDDDSDSEHLPYSPLSNLGNNSDDNLSLSEAPFVDDNVTELEKQNIDITNEDNMDKISTKVDEEINVRQELSYDYCEKQNADYNLITRDAEKSKSKYLNNSMSDKIVENGDIHENYIQNIPQNEDNITGINILEHKVVLNNNTNDDGKQDSINNINNGYRGENVREIQMASKEVRIYVSDCCNKNRKTIKENGFHDINEESDTTSIHSEDIVTSTKSGSRHRLRSNQDKKLEDPLLNPEFLKYVELRQDALTEENPDLCEQEIRAYLYKTWLYEESMKSDVKKNDDLRDINLVKGLNPPQSEAPARTKRNLGLNKKEVPKINTLQRYLRRKKDVVDNTENEEIGLCRKRGMRKNMINDDDDAVSVKEEFGSPNIVNNIVDLSVFNSVKDKPEIPTEDELKTSVDTTIPDRGQEIVGLGKEAQTVSLEVSPLSLNNGNEKSSLVEQLNSDPNTQTKVKDDFDRESIDSEDSETPLIRCKLRSKAKKEKENSIDVKIKEEDADTVSINSEDSEISITKRKKKFNGKKIETTMEDPEFLKYLELRQDVLIDEHPELTQDEIVIYLYQTWLYEENNKSETKKNDEIQQSTLVKGLKDSVPQPKKYRRKVPKTERAEKDSVDEDIPGKEKPKRKSVKPFYNEEYSDIEEELEVFEIFKPKIHKLSAEQAVNSELNPSVSTSELVQERIEVYDEVELYFAELTKPKPNVFKGLIREKVCEICEKCNNLIKCKGCNGMFHINCVKKETEVVETPVPIRGRKKKKRGRKCKNSEEFDNDDSQDSILEDNTSIEEILETDSHAVDADVLEAQLSAKMKEILDSAEKIDYDSYSSDDCLDWNKSVPGKCQIVDVKLKPRRSALEIENFKCNNCQQYDTPVCFVCKNAVSKQETTKRQKCHFAHCHKYYHLECLDIWPQTQFNGGEPSKNNKKINEYFEALTCPRHVCHTCVSDDPRGCKTRFSGDKLARCVRCPATYHSFTKCLPAGTQILTASHIICPRHSEHRPPGKVPCHVNTGWCFICALGGSLICCEYCPTSFHAECLNIDPPEGGYMCEDCETGRLPLYGEMVWVKLGHYRWWPGIILHPYEIPENLLAVKHSLGEFVVRFFGQYDHYWVNRGRVFPFQEGDSGRVSGQKSKIDAAFTTAMEHAQRACEILKKAVPNEEESMDIASSLLPPHYVKLKVNKPCGSLCGRRLEDPESSLTQCDCNPNDEDPCGPYSQCLNRMLLTECGPTCRAGDRCNNRAFEKRLYPKLVPYRTPSRGWGLKTLEDIKAGQFVIEYVGELIDEEEFKRRMRRKHEIRDENFYFLTLDKERMIDAGPKGNLARFMNHCCEPNCETQKWTVLGDVRVGLFALYDIPANSEVTFNYNLECAGIDKKRCMCGAKRCSGYIGAKPKQEESQSKKNKLHPVKRTYKKRKPEESPSTKNKPKRPIGRPPKPKELTEIEKDLLIIRNATNGLSSDESSKSLSSELDKNPKALKRKRVNFSTEEIVVFDGTESPSVKKSKIDDKLEGD